MLCVKYPQFKPKCIANKFHTKLVDIITMKCIVSIKYFIDIANVQTLRSNEPANHNNANGAMYLCFAIHMNRHAAEHIECLVALWRTTMDTCVYKGAMLAQVHTEDHF